jgi:hypothetical protein
MTLPAGNAASEPAIAPLVVGSRSRPIVWVMFGGFAVGLFMVLVRRGGDLEFDEWLMSAGALVLGFWLSAQACGLLLRRTLAGHALRVDGRGIHHPGWEPVPWSDVRDLRLRRVGGSDTKSLWHLVLDVDPRCAGPRHGSYVRWLFGPIEGLWRPGRPVEIPLFALDAEPQQVFVEIEIRRAAAAKGRP